MPTRSDSAPWHCLADSGPFLPAAAGAALPTSASALEGLAELIGNAGQAAQLHTAIAAYQAQNPLYRELNYISRHVEEFWFADYCSGNADAAVLGEGLGRHLHFSHYGLLGYLMLLSPTLGQALTTALQFPLQLGSYFHIRLLQSATEAKLQFTHYSGRPELFRFHLRLCAEAYRQIMADLGGFHRDRLQPCYRDQGDADDALCFDRTLLATPLPYAQASVFAQTLGQCQALERQIRDLLLQPLVLKVRALLQSDLRRYSAMNAVAAELHMSERTLHRHLRKSATTFQLLLDDVRLHRAVSQLHSRRHSLAQIAEELGFADASAFTQAFKRWTGHSPKALIDGQTETSTK